VGATKLDLFLLRLLRRRESEMADDKPESKPIIETLRESEIEKRGYVPPPPPPKKSS
jgi:hypothetical protein